MVLMLTFLAMMPYILLVLGWVVYLTLHSVLASPGIKKRYAFKGYRIAYTVFSVAGLLALLFYNGSISSAPFFLSAGPPRYISLVLTTFGVMIIQASFRQYSFRGFVGLGNEPAVISREGILKHVRHPIYAGTILVIAGFFLFIPNLPTLISCLCMLLYMPIGIMLEERKLIAMYGNDYVEYMRQVPALFPKLK
jgi:protein-S-isoprenylcysteine O-methyltransferase Ste14